MRSSDILHHEPHALPNDRTACVDDTDTQGGPEACSDRPQHGEDQDAAEEDTSQQRNLRHRRVFLQRQVRIQVHEDQVCCSRRTQGGTACCLFTPCFTCVEMFVDRPYWFGTVSSTSPNPTYIEVVSTAVVVV